MTWLTRDARQGSLIYRILVVWNKLVVLKLKDVFSDLPRKLNNNSDENNSHMYRWVYLPSDFLFQDH